MKTLIVYYSLDGKTKLIGDTIADYIGADVFELDTIEKLPMSVPEKYIVAGKQVFMKETPELVKNANLNGYDRIILGSPVWALTYAPAIRTFLRTHDLYNKDVYFYCTHEGIKKDTIQDVSDVVALKGSTDFAFVLNNTESHIEQAKSWIDSWK
jgi:flavodoxin